MSPTSVVAFVDSFDETSFLVVGSFLLLSLLLVQVVWAYRNGTSQAGAGRRTQKAADDTHDVPTEAFETDTDVRDEDVADSDDMIICPECERPTEAEYRYCRNCAGDTGKSYVGSSGDDGSNRSGML